MVYFKHFKFKIHLCCSPIVIFSKQISIYLEAEEYLPMKITHSDEIIKLIMYTAFKKSSHLSGNLEILGLIRLFIVLKERPETTHVNMDVPTVCFCQ